MAQGINDTVILLGIMCFLVLVGVVSPFISQDLGIAISAPSVDVIGVLLNAVLSLVPLVNTVAAYFNFGYLPVWLQAFLEIPRFLVSYILFKAITGTGG